jgi:hypothetical protein
MDATWLIRTFAGLCSGTVPKVQCLTINTLNQGNRPITTVHPFTLKTRSQA